MHIAVIIFWISGFLIAYTYFLYPLVLFCGYTVVQLQRDIDYLNRRRNRRVSTPANEELPRVTMIVPVYNEEEHLLEKIANLRQSDYPSEKVEVIFISDGSTDRTNEILSRLENPGVKVILKDRGGKPTALNVGVERALNPILIFSDGSTFFEPDAIRMLVRHFSNPNVGAVCGALKFEANQESQQTEGIYWRYENVLRLMESRFGATLTASGAIYALRRQAWVPLSADTVLDDFITPMNARKQGYSVIYDPEAMASDFAPNTIQGEFTRRVRIAVGSFRSLGQLLNAPLPSFTGFAFFSHKFMRWVVPQLLLALLITNFFLLDRRIYAAFFGLQMVFYCWAAAGFLFRKKLCRIRFASIGYFLVAMHLAFLVGLIQCMSTRKEAIWQRVN
jgi:cellulose synthase/poly-beta-1,6-N-acetylglucosamine synthase-like glycosyltransferase